MRQGLLTQVAFLDAQQVYPPSPMRRWNSSKAKHLLIKESWASPITMTSSSGPHIRSPTSSTRSPHLARRHLRITPIKVAALTVAQHRVNWRKTNNLKQSAVHLHLYFHCSYMLFFTNYCSSDYNLLHMDYSNSLYCISMHNSKVPENGVIIFVILCDRCRLQSI